VRGRALRCLSLFTLGLLVLTPVAAVAQEGDLGIAVRGSQFAQDGTTELVVNVTGSDRPEDLGPESLTVTENGQEIAVDGVAPLLFEGPDAVEGVAAMLAIDVSGSMRGEPWEATRPAAIEFARALTEQGVEVGLMTFGSDTTFLSDPTTDTDTLVELIEEIVIGGSTSLYDAIIDASEVLAESEDTQQNLVVFTDRGGDTSSDASLDDAVRAANEIELPVLFAALEIVPDDLEVIQQIADGTDGRVLLAASPEEVAGVFEELALDLASQYVVSYSSAMVETGELDIEVSVVANGAIASTSFVTLNPRQQLVPQVRPPSDPGLLASSAALYVGAGGAFLALLLILALMFTGQRTRGDRLLADQLERHIHQGDRRAGRSGLVATHFRERAMAMIEAAPKPKGFDEKLSQRLEQAAWPLRNGEFIVLCAALAIGIGGLSGVLFNWLGGILLGLVAGSVPWVILEIRRSRRQAAFLQNLPDTLQLMAGSLRAGYGVLQAIDTVAREAPSPTSEEFQRVITEARLGMPVEEALEAMAERINSEDFRWVVLAINIQREVGGNLAELLDAVAETLREREMLRRQIKVLSAEGRLSAVILIALPFVLALYLILVRPAYIATLVTSGLIGWVMVGMACVLMLIGVIWIRKMIQIEV
jgi:tight adherence protein B